MTTPLLKTKLYIPPTQPSLVARPRLVARLNEAVDRGCRLVLLSAPAGSGKTTLLSEWIHGRGTDALSAVPLPVGWVSLDAGDNDPVRFFEYVVAALQSALPVGKAGAVKAALTMLRSPTWAAADNLTAIEPLLAFLINEMFALPGPLVLVLDDYHAIQAPLIHEAMAYLLDHAPSQLHLVLATRADPPLPVSRLRGRGQVVELRQADLRFSPNEAAAFLGGFADLDLPADQVAALSTRTEGWIAGLQMAALAAQAMQSRDDVHAFVAAFAGNHRHIAGYLRDEVLSRQDERMRAFMLRTSILDLMSGPLCDALTGQGNGRQMLETLREANLFVVPLDDEERWYRYHGLFAGLLQQRLQQTEPDAVPDLHRRASVWYEQNGLVFQAVHHALLGRDLDRVEQLVAARVLTVTYRSELATWKSALESLPRQVVRARPWLSVAYAWVLAYTGRIGELERLLQDAEPAGTRQLAGHIAALGSYCALENLNLARAVTLARDALVSLPEEDIVVRSFATEMVAVGLRLSGALVSAARATREAIALAQTADAGDLALDFRCDLARLQMNRGRLHEAAATCQLTLQLARKTAGRGGLPAPVTGYVLVHCSLVLYEQNDLVAALRHIREGVELCKRWGGTTYLNYAYLALARVLHAMGDVGGAAVALQEVRQDFEDLAPWLVITLYAQEIELRLAQRDAAAAWQCAQVCGLGAHDAVEFYHQQEYQTLAKTLLAVGRIDAALALLGRLLEQAEAAGAMGLAIKALALQAVALQANGRPDPALDALGRALVLGGQEGYVRSIIDAGPSLLPLLQRAVSEGRSPRYASALLAALTNELRGRGPGAPPGQAGLDPLSERELEVLRLLPTHLSRPEIAERLYVSPNTVRFHLKNIYSKLGVHNRADAIQRAKDLNLL